MITKPEVQSLDAWVAWCQERVRADYDVLVLVTGKPGVGKSHTSHYLAGKVDPTFDIERMVFSGAELVHRSERIPKYGAITWDEIVEGGLAIDAITTENKRVLKHLITGRSLNLITFACAPKLKLFQTFTREDRADWWIHLPRRGVAVFHDIKDTNPYPGAKPFYPQQFVLTGIPKMDPLIQASYEARKNDWRRRWKRDSKRYIKSLDAKESEEREIAKIMKLLAWLPDSINKYERTFPGHDGKLQPWEREVKDQIERNQKART